MLSPEQIQKIKSHLLNQLDNFPEDQRKIVKHKILSMTDPEVEEFIKQNQLKHLDDPKVENEELPKCIFCNILAGKIPSYKIAEDEENLVILEINPISKGHALVVPKKHVDKESLPNSTTILAKKLSSIIKTKFNPSNIENLENEITDHGLIEIIPLYGDEKERYKATEEQLKSLQKELTEQPKPAPVKEEKIVEVKKEEPLVKIKPRIP